MHRLINSSRILSVTLVLIAAQTVGCGGGKSGSSPPAIPTDSTAPVLPDQNGRYPIAVPEPAQVL